MKNTGIVRKVDNLGRIIIPKEIRKRMCIHDDEPMEIYIEGGKVILQKFSPMEDMSGIHFMMSGLYKTFKRPIMICDREKVIQGFQVPSEIVNGALIAPEFTKLIDTRRAHTSDSIITRVVTDSTVQMLAMHPIITPNCDLYGAVVMFAKSSTLDEPFVEMALGTKLMADSIAEYFNV